MMTKDFKDRVILRDWTALYEALREFSIKHNISFVDLTFRGYWDGGCYTMPQYGNIRLEGEE